VRFAAFAVTLVLISGCASREPHNLPEEIATSWCQQHDPDDRACLEMAIDDHVHCMTAGGGSGYDQCRVNLLTNRQAAERG
jgi:hypothetical protein